MHSPPTNRSYVIDESFFLRPVVQVAIELLGKRLVSVIGGQLTSGLIVETEAYLHTGDSASHSARGKTPSNQSMFGSGGFAYVYPIHAKHCFNVVTQSPGEGSAALVRSIQPIDGVASMLVRRQNEKILDLCRGPARLCQAMAIDRQADGRPLIQSSGLWIDNYRGITLPKKAIKRTQRIGVTSAEDKLLRFVVRNCQFVSGPKRMR